MIPKEKLRRVLDTVDTELKSTFPYDYSKRCIYAATATKTLLEELGYKAVLVSGNILIFVVSAKGDRASYQGFGAKKSDTSHFWIECEDTLIDVTPSYLNVRSSFPLSVVPRIAWSPLDEIPSALGYEPRARYSENFEFTGMEGIKERVEGFCRRCSETMTLRQKNKSLTHWILFDQKTLETKAKKKSIWALSAIKLGKMKNPPTKPVI